MRTLLRKYRENIERVIFCSKSKGFFILLVHLSPRGVSVSNVTLCQCVRRHSVSVCQASLCVSVSAVTLCQCVRRHVQLPNSRLSSGTFIDICHHTSAGHAGLAQFCGQVLDTALTTDHY